MMSFFFPTFFRLYTLFIWRIGKVLLQYMFCFHSLYFVNDSSHQYRNYFFQQL